MLAVRWLGTYICNWLSGWLAGWLTGWLAILLCLVVTFRPRFHSDYLAPSSTALSKRLTMVQMFLLNCLPPTSIYVLKHIRTRLIILTGGKNNRKLKGQAKLADIACQTLLFVSVSLAMDNQRTLLFGREQ